MARVQRNRDFPSISAKLRLISQAVSAEDDLHLRALGLSEQGFVSREWRRVAWQRLLVCDALDAPIGDFRKSRSCRVIEADVQRCGCHWDLHQRQRKTRLARIRRELAKLIHETIAEGEEYYQGFHELALVVLEISGNFQTAKILLRGLVRHKLHAFLKFPFNESLVPLLDRLRAKLELHDPEISEILEELHFAIPWILTWYSHNILEISIIHRIFDFLIASTDASDSVVSLACALVIAYRESIILHANQDEDPAASVLVFVQSLPSRLDSAATEKCIALAEKFLENPKIAQKPRRMLTTPVLAAAAVAAAAALLVAYFFR